jgi:predicted RND superfamily exporter protein
MNGSTRIHELLAGVDHQRYIDWVDHHIVTNSRWVILLFLILTAVFALGLGNISTETGTDQFTTGLPAEEAYQDVQREFSPSFEADTGGTSLIQREENVLSKPSLLRMLRLQHRAEQRTDLRVRSTTSAASLIALELDPGAETTGDQISAIERASPTEIRRAVRDLAATDDRFRSLLSDDFNREAASASATIGSVTHEVPAGISDGSGQGGASPLTSFQLRLQSMEDSVGGDITVFGSGIVSQEFSWVLVDSMLITVPAALLFILLFLVAAYRDLADLLLGALSLGMAIIWTFGFLGLAGIPFSNIMIAVPPLLLAVGIDFGIHAVNRYREEREDGRDIGPAMRVTTDQLTVAFFIVTGTTVIGFLSNLTSALPPIRDFGTVAAIGIVFTFLIFGVFLPAAKVELDRVRRRTPIPTFSTTPLGSEGGVVASVLQVGVVVARRAPAVFLVVMVLSTAWVGVYATGVDTSFEQEDFLPPEENPQFIQNLPEPFRPHEYTSRTNINYLEENFESTDDDTSMVYIQAPMTRASALESVHRAGENPPESILRTGRDAEVRSIVTVIQTHAEHDSGFAALVDRNDIDDDGIPDRNLQAVYESLLDSPARDDALEYITEDYSSARVVYSVEGDAPAASVDEDTRTVAGRMRLTATATGSTIVFQAIADLILETAVTSLVVALLVGSMRALSIPFNSITASLLGLTIGLGIDYSVHMVHRFADEREQRPLVPALERTVRGTGGALLGSMLTTVSGIGVLSLALFSAIQQFGILTGLSIVYAFLTSVVVLPSALVVWDHFASGHRSVLPLFGVGTAPWHQSSQQAPGTTHDPVPESGIARPVDTVTEADQPRSRSDADDD